MDTIERVARWLLPDGDDISEGELLFFSFVTLACVALVAVVWH